MTDRRSSLGIGHVLLLLAVVAGFVLADAAPAEARHKVDLARGLAQDFQFYDLAKDILNEELQKAIRDGDNQYRTQVAFAFNHVLLMEADYHRLQRGDQARYQELLEEARKMIEDNATGGAGQGMMNMAQAEMQEGRALVRAAESSDDFDERIRLRQAAVAKFRDAWQKFYRNVAELLPEYQQGRLTDEDEITVLRSSWYHWSEASLELAKLGETNVTYVDPTSFTGKEQRTETYLELIERQTTELRFEFDFTFVAYYSILLVGDAYVLRGQYGRALGEYRSILDVVPRYFPVERGESPPPGAQAALDDLRLNAYQKTAEAYLELNDDRRVITTVDEMLADYSDSPGARQVKLGRLFKAEALARLILSGEREGTLEEVIAAVEPLATDPDPYFRFRYNQMLANIGLSPYLDVETRVRSARAAMSIAMLNEATQIYRKILDSLPVYGDENPRTGRRELDVEATKRNFEAYAPEAYWNMAVALYSQRRNMEAAMVYYRASLVFTYFHAEFAEAEQLPEHMLNEEGTPRFDRFETMQNVRQFAVDLARRASACMTDWHPLHEQLRTNRIPDAVEVVWLDGMVEWNERRLYIAEHGRTYMETYQEGGGGVNVRLVREAFRFQQRQREAGRDDYMPAITMLAYVDPSVGARSWNSTNNMLAELMRREYSARVSRRNARGTANDPFPEGRVEVLDMPEEIEDLNLEFPSGVNFYRAERDNLSRNLGRLPSSRRAELEQLLDVIVRYDLSEREQRREAGSLALIWGEDLPKDVRLLYWYKTRYFHLRFIYATISQDRRDIEQFDPQAWEGSLGSLVQTWAEVQQDRLERTDSDQDRLRIRDHVNLVAERVYRYGVLLRNNPWADTDGDDGFLHERPDAVEFNAELRSLALDVWSNYHDNFRIGFEFPEDDDRSRHERAQRLFDQQVRGILYMIFFQHLRMNNPSAAEEVYEEFSRIYPSSVRQNDDQLERWHGEMIQRLSAMYGQIRIHASRRLGTAVRSRFNPVIGDLRRHGDVRLDNVQHAIEGAMLVRVERRRGVPLLLMDKQEVKIAYLFALVERHFHRAFTSQIGAIDEIGLLRFAIRQVQLLEDSGILQDTRQLERHLGALAEIGDPLSEAYEEYIENQVRPFMLEQLARHRDQIGESAFIEGLRVHERDRIFRDREDLMRLIEPGSPLETDGEVLLNVLELGEFAPPMQRRLRDLAVGSLQEDAEEKIAEIHSIVERHFIYFDREPHVTFELAESRSEGTATYDVVVTSFSRGATGAFTLWYRQGDRDWQSKTGRLTARSDVEGTRHSDPMRNRYQERFTIEFNLGRNVPRDAVIVLRSNDFMPQMVLHDSDGNEELIRSTLAEFVHELRSGGHSNHPRVLQMHTGHIKRVLNGRFYLADRMREVGESYNRIRAELNRDVLPYTFQVMGTDARDLRSYSHEELFGVAQRALQSEFWQEALIYTNVSLDRRREQEAFRNFVEPPDLEDDSLPRIQSLQHEIHPRWLLGHAHMQLGLREGGYSPDSENWEAAIEHLSRLHLLIRRTNHLRQRGRTDFAYREPLENFYYNILDDLVTLYTSIARYHEQRRDFDQARAYLHEAHLVHTLGVIQASNYSPRQRMNRYRAYRAWYEMAQLENSRDSNAALERCWRQLLRAYHGRHPDDILLDDDHEYNALMDELYHNVLALALERNLDIPLPEWMSLKTD